MNINKDDYIEGIEYYGDTTKTIRGWVDKVYQTEPGLIVDIQCDDHWKGARGSSVFEELGEIKVLEKKDRPVSRF